MRSGPALARGTDAEDVELGLDLVADVETVVSHIQGEHRNQTVHSRERFAVERRQRPAVTTATE